MLNSSSLHAFEGNYSPPFWGGVGGEAVGGEAVGVGYFFTLQRYEIFSRINHV